MAKRKKHWRLAPYFPFVDFRGGKRGKGCVVRATLPRYSETQGWHGGAKNVLYAVTDRRTRRVIVRPREDMRGVGPAVTVRVATRGEAERHWQRPLHSGWKVKC
jgi:hypothetical protein